MCASKYHDEVDTGQGPFYYYGVFYSQQEK